MASGQELIARVVDRVPEMGDNTGALNAAEEARILRTLNMKLEDLNGAIASLGEDYQFVFTDWSTVASRSPNEYTIGAGGDINIADYKDIRYLERIIDDSQGIYERIYPLQTFSHKDENNKILWFDLATNTGPGKPRRYKLSKAGLIIYPISDQVYPMRLWYTAEYAPIVNTAADTLIPSEMSEYLVFATAADEKLLRNEFEASVVLNTLAESKKREGLANLQVHRDDQPHLMHFDRYAETDYV